jgi:hypothetical protein
MDALRVDRLPPLTALAADRAHIRSAAVSGAEAIATGQCFALRAALRCRAAAWALQPLSTARVFLHFFHHVRSQDGRRPRALVHRTMGERLGYAAKGRACCPSRGHRNMRPGPLAQRAGEKSQAPRGGRADDANGPALHGLIHVHPGFRGGSCSCPPCASRAQIASEV